jgi:hypothetical protein
LILKIRLAEIQLNDHRAFAGGWSFIHEGIRGREKMARLICGPGDKG